MTKEQRGGGVFSYRTKWQQSSRQLLMLGWIPFNSIFTVLKCRDVVVRKMRTNEIVQNIEILYMYTVDSYSKEEKERERKKTSFLKILQLSPQGPEGVWKLKPGQSN
ncbi:hypothetical protein TNCT_521491 [Trichonephila clavata]|uniref:Uncharacterized protein n=1 Tax=Trichonephila clavata TaxID=2740835 RepID=A0A8X6HLU3_TRICU|nr:hypothetical protein TNCT_521491 [Trichonephila clavata]